MTHTFGSHGSDVVEPFFDCGHPVRWVFVSPAGNLGDGRHGTLQSTARLGYHGVMTQVKVKGLNNVR